MDSFRFGRGVSIISGHVLGEDLFPRLYANIASNAGKGYEHELNGDTIGLRMALAKYQTIENKAERRKRENLALETWSNEGARRGWMYTCCSEVLFYHFLFSGDVYELDFPKLLDWAFVGGRNRKEDTEESAAFQAYEEKSPECDQHNKTLFRPVPILKLRALGVIVGTYEVRPITAQEFRSRMEWLKKTGKLAPPDFSQCPARA